MLLVVQAKAITKGKGAYDQWSAFNTVKLGVVQKLVNLTKEINPEKKGSIYDVKFQKKWEASCDEAELFAIYKSAYRSYCITQRLCIILWLFCIIGGFVWGFGAVPVLLVSIIWGTMITSYCYYAIHLSN